MGRVNKRISHLNELATAKRRKTAEANKQAPEVEGADETCKAEPHYVHWEGLSDSEEDSDVELSDEDEDLEERETAFTVLLQSAKSKISDARIRYSRGPILSERQQRRRNAAARERLADAQAFSQPITRFFSPRMHFQRQAVNHELVDHESVDEATLRREAINRLEKLLDKKKNWTKSSLNRHRAVLALLYLMQSRQEETREQLSLEVAKTFGKGVYFARKIIEFERLWMQGKDIPESQRGRHGKITSWLNDEGAQLAVRESALLSGERMVKSP